MRVRAVIALLIAVAIAACAGAPREEVFVPDPSVTPSGEMEATLRAAVEAQRRFRTARGTFAASADQLIDAGGFTPRPGVTLVVLKANDTGWAGRTAYADRSGRNCVVYDGTITGIPPMTDGEGLEATEAGVPVCDPPVESAP